MKPLQEVFWWLFCFNCGCPRQWQIFLYLRCLLSFVLRSFVISASNISCLLTCFLRCKGGVGDIQVSLPQLKNCHLCLYSEMELLREWLVPIVYIFILFS